MRLRTVLVLVAVVVIVAAVVVLRSSRREDQSAPTVVAAPPAPAAQHEPEASPEPRGERPSERPRAAAPRDAALDEAAQMQRLREAVKGDPAAAVALARELEKRYPASPFAEERAQAEIQALVNQERIGAARDRAEEFLRRWPTGQRARQIMNLTGVHPRPRAPIPMR